MEYLINVTHRQNISLSSLKANVLLTDRIPVSISVHGSWVTDRWNAKIAYFKGKGVSRKQTNSNFINIDTLATCIHYIFARL